MSSSSILLSYVVRFLHFLRQHPIFMGIVVLLLSPPVYRLLRYFTPLLLSTALCIFALFTLAPYVTATDAEVERQCLLGPETCQNSKGSGSNDRRTATQVHEVGVRHQSSASTSSSTTNISSSLDSVTMTARSAFPDSSSPTPASENSWMNWINGLNDIGRMWMESKLAEQGLSLSEPANRETLLAFIEGSFAELITVKGESFQVFPVDGSDSIEAPAGRETQAKDEVAEGTLQTQQKVNAAIDMAACKSISASSKEALEQRKGDIVDSIEPSRGVSDQASERLLVSAPDCQGDVPLSESSHEGDTAAMSGAQLSVNSAGAIETSKGGADVSPKPKSVQAVSLRTRGAKEKALPVQESVTLPTSDTQSVGTVAKTPSRIPVPSKIFEASRRMFSKDDQQGKTTMPPPKASSVQPSKSSSTVTANTQSRLESTASALKLSTRKFLDRSKAVVPGKLSSNSAANRGSIDIEPDVAQGEVQKQSADACAHNEIGLDEELAEENGAPGPKFDEDLQVEEAQALVQSELKMLEVELEEVAAKLPKLDEACAYQKTPVKLYHSSTSVSTPTRLGLRSNVALFSSNSSSKQ